MNPFTFLSASSLSFKILLVLALAAGLVGYGFMKGNAHGTDKLDKLVGEQAKQSLVIMTKRGEITERIVLQYRERKAKTEVVTQTITNEVTKYVEGKPLTLSCVLDQRWVRLHDAAAAGELPPPASGSDGAPGGVTAAGSLPSITGNYARAIRNRDRLKDLQQWADDQSKVKP